MALVVEDGTIVANAESFITVADADAYFTARGVTAWTGMSESAKEQALRQSADYMEQMYRSRWQGFRVSNSQELSWPRTDVVVDGFDVAGNIVPEEVGLANAELAFRASTSTLLPDEDKTRSSVIKEKIDTLEVGYSDKTPLGRIQFQTVEKMLEPFFGSGSGSIRLVDLDRS